MKRFLTVFCVGAMTLGVSAESEAARLLVDFGGSSRVPASPTSEGVYWNVVTSTADTLPDLVDASTGIGTGASLGFVTRFQGVSATTGYFNNDASFYDGYATSDTLYGTNTRPLGQIQLSGLDASGDTSYSITFYASRDGVTDSRQTMYTVTGNGVPQSTTLEVANNTNSTAVLSNLIPDANGSFLIDVQKGAGNTNGDGFYYIGLIDVNSSPVPEPSALALLGIGGTLLALRRRAR